MGGYGSTRWAGHEKAATVEESLALDVADLVRLGLLLREPATVSRSVSWTVSVTGETRASVYLTADTLHGGSPSVDFRYNANGTPMSYRVLLESTRPPLGGRRWWWVCPLAVNGRPCGKRVQKLYLPPSASVFGCRSCHGLAYRVSQEHDKGVDAFLRDPAVLRSALSAPPEELSAGTRLKALKAGVRASEKTAKMLRRWER